MSNSIPQSARRWLSSRAFAWVALTVLALLCGLVAVLQYNWIGEISISERQRLEEALKDKLSRVQRAFDAEERTLVTSLVPDAEQIATLGREPAYEARYQAWKAVEPAAFRTIALAIPEDGKALVFKQLDPAEGRFNPTAWPAGWEGMHDYLSQKLSGPDSPRGNELLGAFQIELPRFGPGSRGRHEQEWLLLEFDPAYLQQRLFPALLRRLLNETGSVKYNAAVVTRTSPAETIYESSPNLQIEDEPDGSITLLASGPDLTNRGGPRNEKRAGFQFKSRPPGGPRNAGRWLLLARHREGSLEALVEQTRRRNLALSGGLLLLILGTAAALVHYSRQSQQLSETRMNFVANVSHELRTPLTVIRTASFNLRGKLAHNPDQVERYGKLIQTEAERLSALVEQVLLFANAKTQSLLGKLGPVSIPALIEKSLAAAHVGERSGLIVETKIAPDVSIVLADEIALAHALENLIDNAVKHGANQDLWIGVSACQVEERGKPFIEFRVADHGPGIPSEEQSAIFEPFYRGRRAMDDQVRGAGLGLDLVKKIAEAHGGSVRVNSVPWECTEFLLRIPAADGNVKESSEEESRLENEFAHPAD